MLKKTVRTALAGLLGAVALVPAYSAPSQAAPVSSLTFSSSSKTDRSAAFTRINNYASKRGTVFSIRLDMRAGETRLVKSKLKVGTNPNMTDSFVAVGHRLHCYAAGSTDKRHYTKATRNVRRGAVDTSYNSFFFKAPRTGTYLCETYIDSTRPRPASSGKDTNWSRISSESWLQVGVPRSFARQSFDYKAASPMMVPGATTRTFNTLTPFRPNKSTMSFNQTIYLTSCTAKSGSTDSVTGTHACTKTKNADASAVAMITVRAYDKWAKNCKTYNVYKSRINVTRDVHHHQVQVPFSVRVSPSCSDSMTVTTRLGSVKGAPLMVHKQGMILRTN